MPETVVIFGSNGQIGTVLTKALIEKHGPHRVFATDIRPPSIDIPNFALLDVTQREGIDDLIKKVRPTQIYHLAALLSASGEKNPEFTWRVNMGGTLDIFESARLNGVDRVFFPSSIAVFGDTTPKTKTPQHCSLQPTTVYGMSKVSGELWAQYYHKRYGLDVRGLRYPGVVGYQSIPEGGTTDYAVEMFHGALKKGYYECFLEKDTRLPMIYMPDTVKATLDLMDAPKERITVRTAYNLTGMSFTPSELAASIKNEIPNFTIDYRADFRQAIAESWTKSIDDEAARKDWDWQPDFDLTAMTRDMIKNIKKQYEQDV